MKKYERRYFLIMPLWFKNVFVSTMMVDLL